MIVKLGSELPAEAVEDWVQQCLQAAPSPRRLGCFSSSAGS